MAKKNNKTEIAQVQEVIEVSSKKTKINAKDTIQKQTKSDKIKQPKSQEVALEPKKKTTKDKEKEIKKEANLIKKAIMNSPAPKVKENVEFTVNLKEEPKKKISKAKKAEPAPTPEPQPEPKKTTKAKKAEPTPTPEPQPEPKKTTKAKKAEPTPTPEPQPEPKKTTKAKKAEPTPTPEPQPEPKKATKAKKAEPTPTPEPQPEPKKTTKAKKAEPAPTPEPQVAKTEQKELQQSEQPQQPKPQVRYSDEDLEMFKNVILEAKREATEELRMLKERLEDLNSYDLAEESMIYSMHMGEQGSEPMEKEKTYAQIQRINEYIKKLDDALQRIKDKTYGICRVCGILIAKERLLAVPITTLSASWKIHNRCPEDGIDRIIAVK